MKAIISIFFSLLFLMPQENTVEEADNVNVRQELKEISTKFSEKNTSLSYFSVEELRPFSILQFESTVDVYQNEWILPSKYLSLLSESEKSKLNDKIAGYISEFESDKKTSVIDKLKSYIVIEDHLDNLKYSMDITDNEILMTFYNLELTFSAFEHILKMGKMNIEELSVVQKNEAKVNAINDIASLDKKSRLIYYSDFYKELQRHIQ